MNNGSSEVWKEELQIESSSCQSREGMQPVSKHIAPGSTIISDCWRAYGGIERIKELQTGTQAYSHFTVNHSENFVDPATGAHTQTIEGTWAHFKARHKEEKGTSRNMLVYYIYQFMWMKEFKGADVLFHLWSQIAEMYPCEKEEAIETDTLHFTMSGHATASGTQRRAFISMSSSKRRHSRRLCSANASSHFQLFAMRRE